MKALMLSLLLASSSFAPLAAGDAKLKIEDLRILTGAEWRGTLTYLDYRSQKKVSIPANLTVKSNGEDKWSWVFVYKYPDEPKADSQEIITLSKDGKNLNSEVVVERTSLPDGTIRFVTEKKGDDNNRPALFRFTYSTNAKSFSIKKEVRYENESQFFERNEYLWQR